MKWKSPLLIHYLLISSVFSSSDRIVGTVARLKGGGGHSMGGGYGTRVGQYNSGGGAQATISPLLLILGVKALVLKAILIKKVLSANQTTTTAKPASTAAAAATTGAATTAAATTTTAAPTTTKAATVAGATTRAPGTFRRYRQKFQKISAAKDKKPRTGSRPISIKASFVNGPKPQLKPEFAYY
jgi:hypothetical protein